jgi:hypothetical protein
MTYTERKTCNECRAAGGGLYSLFLKANPAQNIEEECLNCGWRDEDFWPNQIKELGFNQAKQEWEENRDCQLNKEIEKEMDYKEKSLWAEYEQKINELFSPQTLTERKLCSKCGEETIHLKENEAEELEEECLPCGWYDVDEDGNDKWWKEKIAKLGKEKAKEEWEANRDSDLNQRIIAELTPKENKEWLAFKNKIDTLFLEKEDNPKRERERQPGIRLWTLSNWWSYWRGNNSLDLINYCFGK